MKYASLVLFVVFVLISSAGFAQSGGGVISVRGANAGGGHFSGSATFMAPRFLPVAVPGAPYSGEETQEHTQTLSDGTHITQGVMRRMMYGDSLGRTRVERPLVPTPRANAPQSPMVVEIIDQAAGVQYTLDAQNKIAHRATVPAQLAGRRAGDFKTIAPNGTVVIGTLGAGPGSAPPPPPPPVVPYAAIRPNAGRPQFTIEKLGTQIIEGALAEGERRTDTIPEGEQGNDRPINITTETWASPELKMVVLRKTSDPRSGETLFKMSNISRTEPDAGLFQPPPDYTIVDETGQFTISYSN